MVTRNIRDGYGRRVPQRLADAFAGRAALLAWCREVEVLRSQVGSWEDQPYAAALDLERIDRHLRAVEVLVKVQIPWEICDCHPDQRDCPKCKGRRWTTLAAQAAAGQVMAP